MCTAVTYKTEDFYFGRTLDNDFSYTEEIVVTPRKFAFNFRRAGNLESHYALIGMACVPDGYPLYYDAVNEKGLCMAGLNFVGNARYAAESAEKINVAQFELIPYILGKCASVSEAFGLLKTINVTDEAYSAEMPPAQLHWIIADKKRALVVEYVEGGLKIYENEVGVLTNNPPFGEQIFNLGKYTGLSNKEPVNKFCGKIKLKNSSRGMGAIGLPGDLSSQSRFVRAAFVKLNSVSGSSEKESVNQFFHILNSVEQPRGACAVGDGYEITIYSSCCNANKGIYYYTTYHNRCISAVSLRNENLDAGSLYRFPVNDEENIVYKNA